MTTQQTNGLHMSDEEEVVKKSLCRELARVLADMAHIDAKNSHLAVLLDTGKMGNNIDVLSDWVESQCELMLEAHNQGIRPIVFLYDSLMKDLYRATRRVVEEYPW